jgi:serpin B
MRICQSGKYARLMWRASGRGRHARSRHRPSSVDLLAVTAALCILVLVATAGTLGLGPVSSSRANPSNHSHAPRGASLTPAAATGAFGLDLMRAQSTPNLVLSPDSVAAALAMTGTGGVGRTAEEIAHTLHLKGPASLGAVGDLQRAITAGQSAAAGSDPEPPSLEIANGLFLQQGLPFEPTFLSGAEQRFAATPETVDFSGDPAGALAALNGWVSEHTRGRIPQILDSLPGTLALALANAIYLDAKWAHPFAEGKTRRGTFHRTDGKRTVQLMHQTTFLRYGAGPGYKAVALPYRSSTLSMMVVLPVRQGLGALQRQLSGKGLARLARGLSTTQVHLSLPSFHLNTAADLEGPLKRLGMPTAFSGAANFSRITTAAPLRIAFVKHQADFVVDEGGTVAAAATVVGVEPISGIAPVSKPVTFEANRPFLFFLRDNRTGAVLFAGRLTRPSPNGA